MNNNNNNNTSNNNNNYMDNYLNSDEKETDLLSEYSDYTKFTDKQEITKEDYDKFDKETKQLFDHTCKYSIGEDGSNVIFMPSPHLFDENGNLKAQQNGDENKLQEEESASARRRRISRLRRRRYFEGEEEDEYAPKVTDLDKACSLVAGSMQCDNVEATFYDHSIEKFKDKFQNDYSILQSRFTLHNGFIQACETAWAKHHAIKIDPTHIWLLILQAIALHVDNNSEELRNRWVRHDGKKKLVVHRDNFVKGLREHNDWGKVIEEFSDQIDENTVEGSVDLLDANFSNASILDKIATKVTIMDICKNYFEYVVRTRCGFPKITLTGKKEDWINIYKKTKLLLQTKVDPQFGQEWAKSLMPILARFIGAFEGNIDCLFWNSMIKRGARKGSGGWEWYSGWVNIFFPIIKGKSNEFCEPYSTSCSYIESGLRKAGMGNDVNNYPNGLASAPVRWEYYSLVFKLKFISGFIGVEQNKETKELRPMIGWVVGEQTKENEQAMQDVQQNFKKQTSKALIKDN